MLKLYNIYENLILESGGKPTIEDVQHVINNNYGVNMTYNKGKDDGTDGVNRYCQVVAIGKTNQGNIAIRVYQITGPNIQNTGKWKTFLLSKIRNWRPTKMVYYSPPDGLFNALGDKTLNVPQGWGNVALYGKKHMEKYRQKYAGWQSDIVSKKQNLDKDREETPDFDKDTENFSPKGLDDYQNYEKYTNRVGKNPNPKVGGYNQNPPNDVNTTNNQDNSEDEEEFEIEEI